VPEEAEDTMKLVTLFLAWLLGYYYVPCPVCGRYIAVLNNGHFVNWCRHK
jgi:hypothetical protein